MRTDTSHWHSSVSYDYVDGLIASDLAWEWLRRNTNYQQDYSRGERRPTQLKDLTREVRERWGLRFPG